MTFKEKLCSISNELDLELFIAKHCEKIRDAMEEAAKSGYRTFQIDIVQPPTGQKITDAGVVNCYTIACKETTTRNGTKCALVAKRVENFLKQLGFDELADSVTISNARCLTIVLKVEW